MTNFTDQLTPAERALLHTALLFFKEHAQEAFSETIVKDQSNIYKEFYKYAETTTNDLMNKIFAECFIDDMDFIKQFNKQWIAAKNMINEKPAIAV